MPITVAQMRALGTRRVALATVDGTFVGCVLQDRLSDAAVVALFARDDDPSVPLVVLLDRVDAATVAEPNER